MMRYLIALTLLASISLHAGTIHKWVDEDGNVHYGDAPPITVKTESVRVQSAPSNPGKSLPRLSTSASDDAGGGSTTSAATDEAPVSKDQAKIRCDQAKEDLQIISINSRIKLKSADGSERFLSTEEIGQRKEQAKSNIDQFCS